MEPHIQEDAPRLEQLQRHMGMHLSERKANYDISYAIEDIVTENTVYNIKHIMSATSLDIISRKKSSSPVVLLFPGPSLKSVISRIKTHQYQTLILAADTSLPVLETHSIIPDYVISADHTHRNYRHFKGVSPEFLSETYLIADPGIYYKIPDLFKDRTVFY